MMVSSRRSFVPGSVDAGATRGRPPLGSFPYGFLTQSANPKALVFFTAILPQFIDPQRAVGAQLAILGVSSIVIELVVLSIYVAACHRTRGFALHARLATPLERVGGALLIGAGLRLAATHRG
jgi:homoserine/homoserine lactone efflux protein